MFVMLELGPIVSVVREGWRNIKGIKSLFLNKFLRFSYLGNCVD